MRARARRVLVVVVVVAALGAAATLLGRWFLSDATCQTSLTEKTRSEQEAFVSAHLSDARDFAWRVMDCDDDGQVVLQFTTRQAGHLATQAFLLDPACHPSTEADAAPGDVGCRVGRLEVAVYLEDTGAASTAGELTWTPT